MAKEVCKSESVTVKLIGYFPGVNGLAPRPQAVVTDGREADEATE